MTEWIAPGLALIGVILSAVLAYKGSKDSDSTDRLSKAAGLYSDYADKMERRVTAVEEHNLRLQKEQEELSGRLDRSEEEAEQYKKEAGDYKNLILEVIQWITELVDWELREYSNPQPRITLSMLLNHLTTFMKDRNYDPSHKRDRG